MREELPPGWCLAEISELADVFLGRTPGKADYVSSGKLKVIKFRDLENGHINFLNMKDGFVREDDDVVAGLRELRQGDMLITAAAHSGDNIGKKCAYVSSLPEQFNHLFFTGELLNVRCINEILGRWVYFFFRSSAGFSEIQDAVSGVHLTGGRAKQMEVPLAPLAEQQRLVVRLEQLLKRVDPCRERLAKIPTILRRFRQAVLVAACSGRLTADWRKANEPLQPYPMKLELRPAVSNDGEDLLTNWVYVSLGDLATLVTSGSRGWAKYYSESGSIFIRAQDISSDVLNLSDAAFVTVPDRAEGSRTRVHQHDLVVTITGANVTKAALVDQALADAYVSQHVGLIRLFDIRLSSFIFLVLISPAHGRRQLLEAAYGQGKPGLNLDNIRDVQVALPPIAEQDEIVRRVNGLFAIADRIERRYHKAKAQVDKLTRSILAKAFRGELVPTEAELAEAEGRDYESAEQLLERIQEQRAAEPPSKRNGFARRKTRRMSAARA